jgi:putative phosphoribosyl transferase
MTAIRIPFDSDSLFLDAELNIPQAAKGIVVFSHGSGSSRHSPRNQHVAKALNKDGLATLLVDLLTSEEEKTDTRTQKIQCKIPGLVLNKFNIKLLTKRLVASTDWVLNNPNIKDLTIGYFGASTGTAAALAAGAARPNIVSAIVSRSGRPDLARLDSLSEIKSPTLLIVGGNDNKTVVNLNKDALKQLGSEKKKLVVVPNATHLFEEPGTLEEVATLASEWFRRYLMNVRYNNNQQ